jgi:hypothetical protein
MVVRKALAALFPALLLSLFAVPSWSAPASEQIVLPRQFGAWTLSSAQEVPNAALSAALGDDFAVLVESGLVSAQRGTYTRSGSSTTSTMAATLYRFRDSSGSYGAYTFLRAADMSGSDLAEKSAVGHDRILAVAGNLLLDLSNPGAASLSDLKTLVTQIQQETPRTSYPTLWQYLPGNSLERNSDHYVLGPSGLAKTFPLEAAAKNSDWLGIGLGAEAESARYHIGKDTIMLLLATYPTPQLARAKLQELSSTVGVQVLDPDHSSSTTSTPAASANGAPPLYGQRRGLMIALVTGVHDPRTAQALIDRVSYQTSVTWNEPSWEAKEPPFLVMIVNILIGTLLLLLYAFVAGLVFAGVRLLVKRFAPGRFFDRDEEVELIQLGLGSKPIEAKDFLSLRSRE